MQVAISGTAEHPPSPSERLGRHRLLRLANCSRRAINLEQTFHALAWPRLAAGKSSSIDSVLMDLGVLDFVECAKSTRNASTSEFPFPGFRGRVG